MQRYWEASRKVQRMDASISACAAQGARAYITVQGLDEAVEIPASVAATVLTSLLAPAQTEYDALHEALTKAAAEVQGV